ncbi:MAG: DUF4149 domain-containing protein [Burkholderiaceae bacterium]|nr:DUF4149 domain-containing protein [Burkholderiaceae bacterium]
MLTTSSDHPRAQRLFLLLVALWVGTLITIGYIVAPTLFATLTDTQVAGMVAGVLFRVEGTLSLIFSAALMVFANLLVKRGLLQYKVIRWYLLAMLLSAAIVGFVLQPLMNALREEALANGFPVMLSPLASQFAMWHGLSSALYLLQTLIGLWLLWKLTRYREAS